MKGIGWIWVMTKNLMKEIRQVKTMKKKMTEYIEVLKLGKLILQKNIDSIEKYDVESNQTDMNNNKKSDERY